MGLCVSTLCVKDDTSPCVCIPYPGFEGDQFQNHFHSEDRGEDHVQDVHHIVKQLRLSIVLQRQRTRVRHLGSLQYIWDLVS